MHLAASRSSIRLSTGFERSRPNAAAAGAVRLVHSPLSSQFRKEILSAFAGACQWVIASIQRVFSVFPAVPAFRRALGAGAECAGAPRPLQWRPGMARVDVKVCLLGSSGVGKTCLLDRYISNQFEPTPKNTIGAAFAAKRVSAKDQRQEGQSLPTFRFAFADLWGSRNVGQVLRWSTVTCCRSR